MPSATTTTPRRAQPGRAPRARAPRGSRRGYTLLELLIVVAVLGLAGALVIPSMTQGGILRVQAAVRTMVSDLTFMQADALAFQSRRVMVFGQVARFDSSSGTWEVVEGNGYTIFEPAPGATTVDLQNDLLFDPFNPERPLSRDFTEGRYGGAEIGAVATTPADQVIYDELGGPAASLTTDDPAPTGTVEVQGPGSRWRVSIEAYTGRVTVERLE